jgi:hypothetical protein
MELAEGQPIKEERKQLIGKAAVSVWTNSVKGMELAEGQPIQEERQQLLGKAADTCLNL